MPVWLRFDLLDGTWLFSDWAQRSLPHKTEWMAALVAEAVAGTGVAGVVISAGPAMDPKAAKEEYVGTGGIFGLRTRLDPLRYRETIIVALSAEGARHKQLWKSLYEAETHWSRMHWRLRHSRRSRRSSAAGPCQLTDELRDASVRRRTPGYAYPVHQRDGP